MRRCEQINCTQYMDLWVLAVLSVVDCQADAVCGLCSKQGSW